ncbi:circularly permutated Ras protein 1-like isoform X2 [Thalassophryne amazonica]|uniref:circularly permutated Ras protein 1-like isoform X2 n=1 Tax=Thalassophryne amazonica TaxID=390379 RepID=UPI0014709F2E|nr:circularly permutated Ras protein 1-like isoform X2 [Thalassophryne amazonica]
MEFACGFVYVAPSPSQKDGQGSGGNGFKRSALFPPHMRPAKSSPYSQPLPFFVANNQIYDLPRDEPDLHTHLCDPNYSYDIPEDRGGTVKLLPELHNTPLPAQTAASSVPSRPSFMKPIPEYIEVLSSSSSRSSSQKSTSASPPVSKKTSKGLEHKGPLIGNPNVILVNLGKLLSEERVQPIQGEPTSCSQCGSVVDSYYTNVVNGCYFCQSEKVTNLPSEPLSCPKCNQDELFHLNPDDKFQTTDTILLFCIDISASMSITSQVLLGERHVYRSRIQFVQEAVLQCVKSLSEQQPEMQVGLITFNNEVTIHGYKDFASRKLSGAELADSGYLKNIATQFPSPPPLCQMKEYLWNEIWGLSAFGTTALGPAALIAVTMASRLPGSKVIICTDGKANTDLGNLEVEDNDARTLLSSTIFYQNLGEYAADHGVTVSVMSIAGTDCRLDELGKLADRTGGKVVIARPHELHPQFEEIIENRPIATHCGVTLLLPKTLRVKGEREADHKGTREVGNVPPNTEITFQFGAKDAKTGVPASSSHVSIQLQIRYRLRNGQMMLRVITTEQEVTDDSSVALSRLSLAIIQLNSSQATAALAVRGRFLDAMKEGELQRRLIEREIAHNSNAEDKQTYDDWIQAMEPIHRNIHIYTRRKSVPSDSQPLTDVGAALLYTLKNSNTKSVTLRHKHKP